MFIVPCRLQISQYSRIIKHAWEKGINPSYALQSHRCKKLCLCIILCMPKVSRPLSVNVLCLITIMIDVYPRHWVTCPFLQSRFTHGNSNFNILTWTGLTMMGSGAREMLHESKTGKEFDIFSHINEHNGYIFDESSLHHSLLHLQQLTFLSSLCHPLWEQFCCDIPINIICDCSITQYHLSLFDMKS